MARKKSRAGMKKNISKKCELCKTSRKTGTPKDCACKFKVGTEKKGNNGKWFYVVKSKASKKNIWRESKAEGGKRKKGGRKKSTRKATKASKNIPKELKRIHGRSIGKENEKKLMELYNAMNSTDKTDDKWNAFVKKIIEKKATSTRKNSTSDPFASYKKVVKSLEKNIGSIIERIAKYAAKHPDKKWEIKVLENGKRVTKNVSGAPNTPEETIAFMTRPPVKYSQVKDFLKKPVEYMMSHKKVFINEQDATYIDLASVNPGQTLSERLASISS